MAGDSGSRFRRVVWWGTGIEAAKHSILMCQCLRCTHGAHLETHTPNPCVFNKGLRKGAQDLLSDADFNAVLGVGISIFVAVAKTVLSRLVCRATQHSAKSLYPVCGSP